MFDRPAVACRDGGQQVLGDAGRVGVCFSQQLGGAPVRFGPVGRRHITVDGAAQKWMGEAKRSLVQHARTDQQIGGPRGVGGCEPGQPGRLIQLGPLQNGHCPSQARRVRPAAPDAASPSGSS